MSRASNAHARMKGPVVPLNVCFNADGTVNYAAVSNYVSWLAEKKTAIVM
ncbi:uncharacterized protein METZ01_LOCUS510241, partial [marine metagenome]